EDGIRDLTVTGVQTCALPICEGSRSPCPREPSLPGYSKASSRTEACWRGLTNHASPALPWADSHRSKRSARASSHLPDSLPRERSEERRVGKECGVTWGL